MCTNSIIKVDLYLILIFNLLYLAWDGQQFTSGTAGAVAQNNAAQSACSPSTSSPDNDRANATPSCFGGVASSFSAPASVTSLLQPIQSPFAGVSGQLISNISGIRDRLKCDRLIFFSWVLPRPQNCCNSKIVATAELLLLVQ